MTPNRHHNVYEKIFIKHILETHMYHALNQKCITSVHVCFLDTFQQYHSTRQDRITALMCNDL